VAVRYLQTSEGIAEVNSSVIVFPIPLALLELLEGGGEDLINSF